MAKDPYLRGAKAQFEALRANRAQALAELEAHKQNGDKYAMGEAIQRIADINAAEQNLQALAHQYVASQQPAPPLSPEERQARPLEKMTPDDALQIVKATSKYGKDLDWNDPYVQAGYAEAARRRSRGE